MCVDGNFCFTSDFIHTGNTKIKMMHQPWILTSPRFLTCKSILRFILSFFRSRKRHCTSPGCSQNHHLLTPWFRFILHVTSTPLHLKESSRHHLLLYERDGSTIHVGLFNRAETTFLLSLQKRGLNLRYMWCLWPRGWIVGRDDTKVHWLSATGQWRVSSTLPNLVIWRKRVVSCMPPPSV